jgi:flagellar M-ring protein FliF
LDKEIAAIERAEQIDLAMEVGKLLVGLIFLIMFFTRIIRPIITWMTTTVEVVAEDDQLGAADIDSVDEEKRRLTEMATEAAHIRESVNEFVTNDPKYTAGVIRKWMREKDSVEKK